MVKEEKLQEGDFEVESSMSFGSSNWCRPMPIDEYRSMESDEHQSILVRVYLSRHDSCSTLSNDREKETCRCNVFSTLIVDKPRDPTSRILPYGYGPVYVVDTLIAAGEMDR